MGMDQIRQLQEIIMHELKDPRIDPMTSVTKVEVAPDLKTCRAYISVLGGQESLDSTVKGLKQAEGFIRHELALTVNLRNTPNIHFIPDTSIAYGVGIVDEARIDEINILQADYEAMRIALQKTSDMLKAKGLTDKGPDLLLNDAVTIPDVEIEQIPIIKGDAKSVSIAAASVLAKVTRDHLMQQYDTEYPQYGFAKHKGYGTAAHIAALKEFGPCPIHRRSFIKKFV
jgi:ribosome-binding factor A